MTRASYLIVTEPGHVELRDRPVPEPEAGEIRVQVRHTAVSAGTERAFANAAENTKKKFPYEPGYCAAGIVESVGKGVVRFRPGDRVACALGHMSLGLIHENQAVAIPDGVPLEQACFLTLGNIALNGVRRAHVELGESAAVIGLGIVGQLALQLLRLSGALPVLGIDLSEFRLRVAEECGADAVLSAGCAALDENIAQVTDGLGPRIVIEATGVPEGVLLALKTVQRRGRVILLGSTRGVNTINVYELLHKKEVALIGSHFSSRPPADIRPLGTWSVEDDKACFFNLIRQRRLNLTTLIRQRVAASEILSAYQSLIKGESEEVGTVLNWD